MRTSYQRVMRKFKGGDRLLSADRRKVIEKVVQAVPGCEIVDQVTHGHASAGEHRDAAEDLWVTVNNRYLDSHLGTP